MGKSDKQTQEYLSTHDKLYIRHIRRNGTVLASFSAQTFTDLLETVDKSVTDTPDKHGLVSTFNTGT